MELLKNRGLKATPQRLSVLKILDSHTHPTIDELYEEVYKNLNMLKDEGLVVEVNMPNQKVRYDIFSRPHIHVVCESCGRVEDYDFCEALSEYKENLERKLGNLIEKMNVLVTVKNCKNCRR